MRAIVTIAAILALSACATTPPADQVILNATIITMDPDNPRAEALSDRLLRRRVGKLDTKKPPEGG